MLSWAFGQPEGLLATILTLDNPVILHFLPAAA